MDETRCSLIKMQWQSITNFSQCRLNNLTYICDIQKISSPPKTKEIWRQVQAQSFVCVQPVSAAAAAPTVPPTQARLYSCTYIRLCSFVSTGLQKNPSIHSSHCRCLPPSMCDWFILVLTLNLFVFFICS